MRLFPVACAAIAIACSSSKKSDPEPQPSPATEPAATEPAAPAITGDTPVETLIAAVRDLDAKVLVSVQRAMAACRILRAEPAPAALETLLANVNAELEPLDPGQGVRATCARALGSYDDERADATLLSLVKRTDEPLPVQVAALYAIGERGLLAALEPTVAAMVRRSALADAGRVALAGMGEPAVDKMLGLLAGETPAGAHPGTTAFVAARALGDLRARRAVPALIAALGKPPMPAMVSRKGEGGPTHHVGVIEALRKIGGAKAAAALHAYAGTSVEPSLQVLAVDAAGMLELAPGVGADQMAVFGDGAAHPQLQIASGLAAARVASKPAELEALVTATAALHKAGEPKKRYYMVGTGLVARAVVGVTCKGELACLQKKLALDDDALAAEVAPRVPAVDSLTAGARRELGRAARERLLIEMRRLGAAARPALPVLLAAVDTDHRLVHQVALDAILAVAERPCPSCVQALDAYLDRKPSNEPTERAMVNDTAAARNLLARP